MTDLAATKRELERVIRENAFPCTTAEARHFLARVKAAIARPEDWRGFMGENGDAPAIRAVIEQADWHARQAKNARELEDAA